MLQYLWLIMGSFLGSFLLFVNRALVTLHGLSECSHISWGDLGLSNVPNSCYSSDRDTGGRVLPNQ